MRLAILVFAFALMWQAAVAQYTTTTLGQNDMFSSDVYQGEYGTITINQDKDIADLLNRYISYQQAQNGIPGYRVHLFFANGYGAQEKANAVKKSFENAYPNIPVYIVYEAPYFKVRAGDFRMNEKNKAYQLKLRIAGQFPNSWIVSDMIQFPKTLSDTQQISQPEER